MQFSTSAPAPAVQLQDVTDADLRHLIYSQECVLVKFVDANCTICRELAPHLRTLANDPRFAHVLFLRIDAQENPVSAKEVPFTKAPFMAAYRVGRLVHCETVFTADRIEDILTEYLCAGEAQ